MVAVILYHFEPKKNTLFIAKNMLLFMDTTWTYSRHNFNFKCLPFIEEIKICHPGKKMKLSRKNQKREENCNQLTKIYVQIILTLLNFT